MSETAVSISGLSQDFGEVTALDDVTVSIRANAITGLVGRNGAGKTTLAGIIAGLRPAQTGTVEVFGAPVWENPAVTSRVHLARDKGTVMGDDKLIWSVRLARAVMPAWDEEYAQRLFDTFEIPTGKKPDKLSTGKRSALSAIVGLASRAEVTIFDEVYLGMDAVARRMFYDELMADFIAHPRTIVLSSHLLDEIEDLLEDVLVIDRGRVAAFGSADDIRAAHSSSSHLASLTDVLVDISTGRN